MYVCYDKFSRFNLRIFDLNGYKLNTVVKIDRKTCLKTYTKFPLEKYNKKMGEDIYSSPKTFRTYKLGLKTKPKEDFTELFAIELTKMVNNLDIENLIFLGDNTNPWLSKLSLEGEKGDKLLQQAIQYLILNEVDKKFNGGLQVDASALPVFLKHFYWLVSVDATLPYFHFIDNNENILGSVHYTGELTISTLNNEIDKLLKDAIDKTLFIVK